MFVCDFPLCGCVCSTVLCFHRNLRLSGDQSLMLWTDNDIHHCQVPIITNGRQLLMILYNGKRHTHTSTKSITQQLSQLTSTPKMKKVLKFAVHLSIPALLKVTLCLFYQLIQLTNSFISNEHILRLQNALKSQTPKNA